jgi:hypothetical protein
VSELLDVDSYLAILGIVVSAGGLFSGCWLLKVAFWKKDRKVSSCHLGFTGAGVLALIVWLILIPGALPFLILAPGRGHIVLVILITVSFSALLLVLLWRPAFLGTLEERFAALTGLPFLLFLVAYILMRVL